METWLENIDFIWEWARCGLRGGLFSSDLTPLFQEPRVGTSKSLNRANKGLCSLPTDPLELCLILSCQCTERVGENSRLGKLFYGRWLSEHWNRESVSETPHSRGLRAIHCGHLFLQVLRFTLIHGSRHILVHLTDFFFWSYASGSQFFFFFFYTVGCNLIHIGNYEINNLHEITCLCLQRQLHPAHHGNEHQSSSQTPGDKEL